MRAPFRMRQRQNNKKFFPFQGEKDSIGDESFCFTIWTTFVSGDVACAFPVFVAFDSNVLH